jgi:hypothetical protein
MKRYDDCREEIGKQLNITFILKKITFLESSIRTIFTSHQLRGLHLQRKLSLKEAEQFRKHFSLKKKIRKVYLFSDNNKEKETGK